MPILILLIMIIALPVRAEPRKCVSSDHSVIYTHSKRCPRGTSVVKEPKASDSRSTISAAELASENDCTVLRHRVEAIDFRLRRSRAFPEDKKNRDRLQTRINTKCG